MDVTLDVRGLSCPQPVILTNNAMTSGTFPLEIIVDTVTSRENIRRMAEKKGYKVQIISKEDDFILLITN